MKYRIYVLYCFLLQPADSECDPNALWLQIYSFTAVLRTELNRKTLHKHTWVSQRRGTPHPALLQRFLNYFFSLSEYSDTAGRIPPFTLNVWIGKSGQFLLVEQKNKKQSSMDYLNGSKKIKGVYTSQMPVWIRPWAVYKDKRKG